MIGHFIIILGLHPCAFELELLENFDIRLVHAYSFVWVWISQLHSHVCVILHLCHKLVHVLGYAVQHV